MSKTHQEQNWVRTRNRLVQELRGQGIEDERVLETIRNTPRHLFMDESLAYQAYANRPLAIGRGQTISQPYIVACMTEMLIQDGVPDKVLEIGTGSGYQTAILAKLIDQVYTVERIRQLQEKAHTLLPSLNLHNVHYHYGDGLVGWAKHAPYPAIIATAAAIEVPPSLLEQLDENGYLVIPIGEANKPQKLLKIKRTAKGYEPLETHPVQFVPMVSGTAY